MSRLKVVEYGVPQGTVLGPSQVSIRLNDWINSGVKAGVLGFADDTPFFYINKRKEKRIYVRHLLDLNQQL